MRRLLLALFILSSPAWAQVQIGPGVTITSGGGGGGSGCGSNCALLNAQNVFTQNNTFPGVIIPPGYGVNGLNMFENTGTFNIGAGVGSGSNNATGLYNYAFGDQSMVQVTTGTANAGFGYRALDQVTTGANNTCVGVQCGVDIVNGNGSTGLGSNALQQLSTGNYNTAQGYGACADLTNGSKNTCIGYQAGASTNYNTFTSISGVTMIGSGAVPQGASDTNEIVIGLGAVGSGSNTITIGAASNVGTTTIYGPNIIIRALAPAGPGCVYSDNTGLLSVVSCGGGGSGPILQVNGSALASSTTVNFENGTNVTVANPSAGNISFSVTSLPMTNVASGTSTGTLLVGTGGSLAASGSGSITATAVPFSGVSAGTNGNALVIGSGGTLAVSGSGTIAATTAAALAGTPTLCSTGSAPTGILANGNATGCQAISGGGGGATLQTNTVNNASQTLLNFTNSASIAFTNTSGGIETAALISTGNSTLMGFNSSGTLTGFTLGTGLSFSGSTLNVTSLSGSGTTNAVPKWATSSSLGNSALSDNGTTVSSTEPFSITSSLPGAIDLVSGTGTLPTQTANSYGFIGPATGGTVYEMQFPNSPSSTGGVMSFGAPATVNGRNVITAIQIHPEFTITSGVGTFGANGLYAVLASTVANNAGHFTEISVTTLTPGSGCTTPPQFQVFDVNANSAAITASTTETYQNNPTKLAVTLPFSAGDNIGIIVSTAGATCPTAQFAVNAQAEIP